MRFSWVGRPTLLGLSLTSLIALGLSGCGGDAETGDAVVVTPPSTTVAAPPAVTPATATTTASTPAAAPAPAAEVTPTKVEGWGTLKGQIVLSGDAPAAKVVVEKGHAAKDPEFCAADASIMSQRLIVDGASKGVKNVLVYIPKPTAVNPEAKKAATSAHVTFDQEKCIFEPHVLAAMTGVPIEIKSSDPVGHNVNIRLVNTSGNKNLAAGASDTVVTSGQERTPGQVVCDIHTWMQAWWMILDSPYFAVTDDNGNFEIKDVPAGTQKVVVWQEAVSNKGFVTAPGGDDVDIKLGDPTVQNYTIELTKLRPE